MGRRQYPRLSHQGKTDLADPAAGQMQGPWWTWKERGHGGALLGVTQLSHESGLMLSDSKLSPGMGRLSFKSKTNRLKAG